MTGMFRWKRHLSEEQLFECYLTEHDGEGIDPPSAEHLADCRKCHDKYTELLHFMDGMWAEADAETAAIFTPDRLRSQQQEIARRLELLGNSGRVLSFRSGSDAVGQMTTHGVAPTISRVAAGWIAAAAAAGLFVGVGAGLLYDGRSSVPSTGGAPTIAQPVENPAPVQVTAPPASNDDNSVSELEAVELEALLDRPRTRELMVFDVLTPQVRDISYSYRVP